MKAQDRLVKRIASGPGPPTWPKNPRQDSYGNPTTKKPGDIGTEIGFKHPGKTQKWLDMSGAHKPHRSKDWR